MTSSQELQAESVIGTTQDGDDKETSSDAEEVPADPQQSSSSQKKKKKKSKTARALNAVRSKSEIPQQLVDRVIDEVNTRQGEGVSGPSEAQVRMALEHLKIMDVAKGKTGLGGINTKNMGEHKFWATQPVPQPGEGPPQDDGYIEAPKPPEEVCQNPYPLPKDFEWATLDITNPNQIKEVYDLLSLNYVEDDIAAFRFQYTAEFLEWALKPPGYYEEWHVGVRVATNKKLVAFISGVPITLRIRMNTVNAVEINYLCVHKKLRSKRLAPVLIKEVTRRCHLKGIFQAIYTGGVVIPTPVSVARYYHRSLNVPKLVDVKFCYVPRNMTLARMIRVHKLPSVPRLIEGSKGLREMEDKDIPEVARLYSQYMERFDMVPMMTINELRHHFLSGKGRGGNLQDGWKGRREGQVVWAFVVENPETHCITDFITFYSLPSTIINNSKHSILEAAYLYYYATDIAFQADAEESGLLKRRVGELVNDALIIADQAKFDVFNALTLMDNVPILQDLKFGVGDGFLNFYLYNWRTRPLAGVNAEGGVDPGKGIGVVML